MEDSVHELTLKIRQQEKVMATTHVYDTAWYFLVKTEGMKVESHFSIKITYL